MLLFQKQFKHFGLNFHKTKSRLKAWIYHNHLAWNVLAQKTESAYSFNKFKGGFIILKVCFLPNMSNGWWSVLSATKKNKIKSGVCAFIYATKVEFILV